MGLAQPQFPQKLNDDSVPHSGQYQGVLIIGRGLPHAEQKLKLLVMPQEHVHVPAT